MTSVFADTFFFLAILNPRDAAHERALSAASQRTSQIVTTQWVLTEVADALAATPDRHLFERLLNNLKLEPIDTVVPASADLYEEGVRLYLSRPDKGWSLTDCISFVVMEQRGIREALTGDHHFEQAGFLPLLQ